MEQQAAARQRLSWADLPSELLSLLLSKYTTTADDYVFLHRVCRAWHHSLSNYSPIPPLPSPQPPFLLLPPRTVLPPSPLGFVFPLPFLNPFHRPTSFSLPQLADTQGHICVGSSHGWVITLDPNSFVFLLNPVTGDSLPLPPLSLIDSFILSFNPDSFPEYHLMQKDTYHSQFSIIHRAVLSSDPVKDPSFTVLLFLSDLTDCCFTCGGGGDMWSPHVHQPLLVEDVIFINGVFLTIDRSISLGVFDFRDRQAGLVMNLYLIFEKVPIRDAFLVESNGCLLVVLTRRFRDPDPLFIPRRYIQVFIFPALVHERDHAHYRALRILKLTECALFVGHGCSVSVPVQYFPWLTEDTIYFTHVYSKVEKVEGGGERRIALYQGAVYQYFVRSKVTTKVFDVENSRYADFWAGPKPYWVTPNLNRR